MKRSLNLLLLMLVLSLSAYSQQQVVSGKVIVKGTRDALPGVTVIEKGTTNGTTTDIDGNYHLSVAYNGTLVFSFIGFETVEIAATKAIVDVDLSESSIGLNEVVAVGYGVMKKSDLTGSVVSVKGETMEDQPFAGIDQALQGRVAGVTVTQNSGAPGGGVSLRVRGITSLTGNNEPLYVIDGVPLQGNSNNDSFTFSALGGGNGQTKVSALSSINPSDIESIEVLKDASASAIYGSRGANGVVLITTKSGKKGKSKVSYEGYYGVQQVGKYIDVMNLKEYGEYYADVLTTQGKDVPFEFQNPELLGEGTDWQKEIFRAAPIQNHQISVSGGNDKTKFYTSLSYFDQQGIVINSDFRRFSMRMNLDHKVNDWIKVGNNVSMSNSKEHITLNDDEAGVISSALRQSPNIPVTYSDGSWGGPTDGIGVGNGRNPVAWSAIRNSELERYKINGNFFLDLTLAEGLTFRNEIGYDFNLNKTNVFNPTYEIGRETNEISTSSKSSSDSFFWVLKNYLNYLKSFGDHSFNAMVGHESQKSTYENLSGARTGFLTNDITALNAGDALTATNGNSMGTHSIESYFGRFNYGFKGKYLMTATLRADASSNFGQNNKWGYFPSFSGAWVITKEPFMEKFVDVVNYAKFRAGYGEVGNQDIGGYAYGASLRSITTVYGTGFSQANIANPDVKWESTRSTNIGLELGFLDNKIKLDVDVYKKTSKDFLFPQPLPSYLGAMNSASYMGLRPPMVNLGEMENKGIDISLTTRNITKPNFTWSSTFVFSTYKNELISMNSDEGAIFQTFEFNNTLTKTAEGEAVGQFYGYQVEGLFKDEADVNSSPSQGDIGEVNGVWVGDIKFKDINGDGKIDDADRTYIGNPHPDFTYSISNEMSYKNFDFSFTLQGSQGNDIYNWTRKLTEGMKEVTGNQAQSVSNRFIAGVNEDTNIPRFAFGDPNNNSRVSDRFVEDGSFLKIQNVTLAYTFNKKQLARLSYISKLRVYATVQNLHTFTKYSGYDPEIGAYNQNSLLMGVDNGRYPVPRTFMMGVNVEF
ncbi:TonB-dependent receptor [Labilibaculum sp. DW002]|uniref:TonB-dependent receptor n=1 Tax=Paralabilibaculum antarcticum TaxID=2912572 RepID=A0ABT5VSX3_9BACT|nr:MULTISPECIES: TonB-dependent receptor [unclassified Labilibaculum]MBI9056930.1 TonB-dependent receptor [Labilibaculum sp.]MDE5418525.1 TonB-dependent receptor [Labilibaculum sp. DW002]